MRLKAPFVTLVLLAASLEAASAAEGRIPLLSLPGPPYVITQPGHYILTRSIASSTDFVVVIQSDHVTLDLGGHTVTGSSSFPAIRVVPSSSTKGITIRNGRIDGGFRGVDAFSGARIRIRLEGLEITGSTSGIVVTADQAEILDCRVHDLAPGPSSVGISVDAFGGRVLDNLIQNIPGGGMLIRGFRAGEIRRNVVRNFGSSLTAIGIGVADSVVLGNTGGAVIADNTVSSLPDGTDDTGMWIETNNNLVTGNTASRNGATGIWMPGSRNRIERNVANQNGVDGLGFSTAQDGNFVVSNESQGNTGCGLRLQGSNVLYRDNLFSDNLGGNVCGTAGTNAGGNYCNLALCP